MVIREISPISSMTPADQLFMICRFHNATSIPHNKREAVIRNYSYIIFIPMLSLKLFTKGQLAPPTGLGV